MEIKPEEKKILLTLEEARKLLGKRWRKLSDSEIQALIKELTFLVDISICDFRDSKAKGNINN